MSSRTARATHSETLFLKTNQTKQGVKEMAQWLQALTALPDILSEFKSQKPHGGSQPSVMGSDALFWCVLGRQRQWTHTHKINRSKTKNASAVQAVAVPAS